MDLASRRYDAAADSARRAYEREPSWRVLTSRVTALRLAERSAEVLDLLENWVVEHPEDVIGRLALAGQLQTAGSEDAALRAYDAVIAAHPNNVVALNNAAWLAAQRQESRALELAERAAELAPDNPAVLDTLGMVLLRRNREAEAIGHLEKAAELAPRAPEIHVHLAEAFAQAGRGNDARATLESLLRQPLPPNEKAAAERLLGSL